jgi:hypothetical protein
MMDLIFSLGNLLVLPFWLGMIVLPRWRWTERLVQSPLIVLAPAALYLALIVPQLGALAPVLMRPTVAAVAAALATPAGATLAWLHFLAFDLFVGRWVYLDSRERGLSPWLMAPLLFLVLMVGPAGLLAYLAARSLRFKAQSLGADFHDRV